METVGNKKKLELAAMNRENREDRPRNIHARNALSSRIQEVYITQVSDKNEGRVTTKLFQEFSMTEFQNLNALPRPDEFL